MVSFLHEGVLELVRNQPGFVAELLTKLLDVQVPRFTEARLSDTTLSELIPIEFHADVVVLFVDDKPVFGAIVEAQLQPDARKRYAWPAYSVNARARHECPFVVLVVTADPATARWAGHPIDLGGNLFRVFVIGPEGIPIIVDVERARREPELAVLSVLAHGDGDPETAIAIARAAGAAIERFPEHQRLLYSALIESALGDAARKAFSMESLDSRNFFSESQRRSYERGKVEAKAEAKVEAKAELLLQLLALRGLAVSDAQRQHIVDCAELATLDRWLVLALSATSADELVPPTAG